MARVRCGQSDEKGAWTSHHRPGRCQNPSSPTLRQRPSRSTPPLLIRYYNNHHPNSESTPLKCMFFFHHKLIIPGVFSSRPPPLMHLLITNANPVFNHKHPNTKKNTHKNTNTHTHTQTHKHTHTHTHSHTHTHTHTQRETRSHPGQVRSSVAGKVNLLSCIRASRVHGLMGMTRLYR